MNNKKILQSKAAIEALEKSGSEGLSRRDAIKMLGIGGAAGMMGMPPSLHAEEESSKSDKQVKGEKAPLFGSLFVAFQLSFSSIVALRKHPQKNNGSPHPQNQVL
jgi:hypothetical protein